MLYPPEKKNKPSALRCHSLSSLHVTPLNTVKLATNGDLAVWGLFVNEKQPFVCCSFSDTAVTVLLVLTVKCFLILCYCPFWKLLVFCVPLQETLPSVFISKRALYWNSHNRNGEKPMSTIFWGINTASKHLVADWTFWCISSITLQPTSPSTFTELTFLNKLWFYTGNSWRRCLLASHCRFEVSPY